MYPYDALAWYERQLDLEYEADMNGFDSVDDYLNWQEDMKTYFKDER